MKAAIKQFLNKRAIMAEKGRKIVFSINKLPKTAQISQILPNLGLDITVFLWYLLDKMNNNIHRKRIAQRQGLFSPRSSSCFWAFFLGHGSSEHWRESVRNPLSMVARTIAQEESIRSAQETVGESQTTRATHRKT